ncbi:MAG TPA: EAL domain-containing protein [Kofleriaceae bacterium]|nr:EAL domain-containing protein [Kofleriaceae bacterium]
MSSAPRHFGKVLVIDDDHAMRTMCKAVLGREGWDVATAQDGAEGIARVEASGGDLDCVVSDVNMPVLDGYGLLRAVRELDRDLPVLLMTGDPKLDGAVEAIEHGAVNYLSKPFQAERLAAAVASAARRHGVARMRRRAMAFADAQQNGDEDHAELERRFRRAIDARWLVYQPIVHAANGAIYSHECLLRTSEASLQRPDVLIGVAERLGRVPELGRAVRVAAAETLRAAPAGTRLFVNLHPLELTDEELFTDKNPLAPMASNVVLELTERARLETLTDAPARIAMLRAMGFRFAIDDLGAGYAGLGSLAAIEPEIVKLDMGLVRDISTNPTKRRIVAATARLCRELGSLVVAEGVETVEERDFLTAHVDLLQGYLFGRPDRALMSVST